MNPGFTYGELISELDAAGFSPVPERPTGFGITTSEYARAKNCTEDVARNLLAKAVKANKLEKIKMHSGSMGAHVLVYCRPGEWKA
jgi:hypothetical protein